MAVESIDAELRLGLPGSGGGSDGAAAKKRRSASTVKSEASGTAFCAAGARDVDDGASPASKVQVVGWPPVGSYRRSTFQSSSMFICSCKKLRIMRGSEAR
uniref:Auxin-responsive protein n=1 Tax=Oryza punctata TaxID=4537 RepID=A0A0E0KK81_ORYPU